MAKPTAPNFSGPPVEQRRIKIDDLTLRGTQQRQRTDQATVAAYAERYAADGLKALPPVVVLWSQHFGSVAAGGHYWLADGHHRVAAAKKAGFQQIEAEIYHGNKRDLVLIAAQRNAAHGLPLSADDKRAMVATLLADPEWRAWSDREIARQLHVSADLVAKIRPQVDGAQVDQRKGADGRTIAKRGTKAAEPAKATKPDLPSMSEQGKAWVQKMTGAIVAERPTLHPHKARILATIAYDAVLHRDDCARTCGFVIDVHGGQLRRADLIHDHSPDTYALTDAGKELIASARQRIAQAQAQQAAIAAKPEPAEVTVDGIVPAEITATVTMGNTTQPIVLKPASTADKMASAANKAHDLGRRRNVAQAQAIAQQLEHFRRWSGTEAELFALVSITGLDSEPMPWTDENIAQAREAVIDAVRGYICETLRDGASSTLPDFATICRLFGLDPDSARIIAERTVPE